MKIGKKALEWLQASDELEEIYLEKGITLCEMCGTDNFLSFAHRYKRNDPRCEHTFEGTLLLCVPCHQKIEYDRDLTDKMFKKLR